MGYGRVDCNSQDKKRRSFWSFALTLTRPIFKFLRIAFPGSCQGKVAIIYSKKPVPPSRPQCPHTGSGRTGHAGHESRVALISKSERQPNSMENNAAANDVVFVDSLHVSANIGPDCWDRDRSQPIDISVYLHLKESYLDRAGASDNVLDSVDYSDLTKKVGNFIKAKSESETPNFSGPDELIKAVSERTFDLAGEAAAAVRVTVGAPKMILLAAGFSVDITTVNDQSKSESIIIASKRVLIKNLVLPVIIGVNAMERISKQRVEVNIIFHENTSSASASSAVVNYQQVVAQLCQASLSFSLYWINDLAYFRLYTGNRIIQLSNSGSIRDASS